MVYEMYQRLSHNRKRLISLFDDSTDQITMVLGEEPVVMQAPQPLRTSVQPPAPTPKVKVKVKPVAQICPRCQSTVCHCPAPQPPPLTTRAPRPHRITTMAEAKRAVIEELTRDTPAPPSFDQIVARQRELGLR